DLGLITFDEPFKKLLNQGMIQGSSRFVYRAIVKAANETDGIETNNIFLSKRYADIFNNISVGDKKWDELSEILSNKISQLYPNKNYVAKGFAFLPLHVDVNIVDGIELDIEAFKKSKLEYTNAEFILEDGKYICGVETEKMSKSKFNTVNPNDIVERFGADTFRMYEMFLGPIDQSKPWDTKGIEGVHRFIKKLWRLFFDEQKSKLVTEEKATADELKVLHRTIKKIEEDTERFSYNTAVSAFMVCVNELTDLKCHKKEVLEQLLILLTPYAPHVSEELWHEIGNSGSILDAAYPTFNPQYLVETTKEYPVSINGKMRTTLVLDLAATQDQVQEIVLANPVVQKWIEGKPVKKFIFVKGKMVNVVI
ncbi:MAG: leucine--tRNA ligase, partial [Chitinophagaceae bacterium]